MRRGLLVLLWACGVCAVGAAGAGAATPAWRIDALSNTTAAPGETLTYVVQITNVGDGAADAATHPLSLTVTLPGRLAAASGPTEGGWDCSSLVVGASSFTCTNAGATFAPAGFMTFTVATAVAVDAEVGETLTSGFEVSGGDASDPAAGTVSVTTVAALPPPFGIAALDGTVTGDPAGTPFTQAGGHPYAATVAIDFNKLTHPAPLKGLLWPVEPVKDVLADLPRGFVGDPTGTERCTAAQLASGGLQARTLCPPAAQVGVAMVRLNGLGARTVYGPLPVYNMVPPPDVPARFGFNVAGTVVTLDAELRSGSDYGLSVRVRNISEGIAVSGTSLTFWGVPADPVHDRERACPGEKAPWEGGPVCATGGARRAFLRNPTACTPAGVGLPTGVRVDSWVQPGVFREASFVSHLPPGYPWAPVDWGVPTGPTGCDLVPFDPGLSVSPGSPVAGAPSGYAFELTLPQSDDPAAVGQSDLRRAVVRLPVGVRVNPSAADGLEACSEAAVGLSSATLARCPDASRVGSLTIETPLLDEPLVGSIYLATPNENPFGSLLAVYLVARGPGLVVKLAGRVDADALSGQLTAVFEDLPQLPFSSVRLAFDGGPRGVLVNPPVCGAHAVTAVLTGWSGAVVSTSAPFVIAADAAGALCPVLSPGGAAAPPRPFAPGFTAGVESPVAGASSPFHLRVTRGDADEELGGLTVRLPRGLVGRLADVVLCAEGDAAAGTCPEGSRIGSVTVGAGAGPLPVYLSGGRVSVTGPYRGAPFGLSIAVPAVAGPFDLGTVVVRAAIHVHRRTAALRIETEPLPTILQGIPLQVRDVRVAIDRPGFMLNPTSCAAKRVRSVLKSASDRVVGTSERFQVGECRRLSFRPRLRLIVGAPGHTIKGQSVPLIAILTQRPGEANIRSVSVTLPSILNARLEVVARACTPAQFQSGDCEQARIGTAVALTPLLRDPLRGGVYLVRPRATGLPNLVVALRGQAAVDLVGSISVPQGRLLRTIFQRLPNVPLTRFILRLSAGANGTLSTTADICRGSNSRARASLTAVGENRLAAKRRRLLHRHGCAD